MIIINIFSAILSWATWTWDRKCFPRQRKVNSALRKETLALLEKKHIDWPKSTEAEVGWKKMTKYRIWNLINNYKYFSQFQHIYRVDIFYKLRFRGSTIFWVHISMYMMAWHDDRQRCPGFEPETVFSNPPHPFWSGSANIL